MPLRFVSAGVSAPAGGAQAVIFSEEEGERPAQIEDVNTEEEEETAGGMQVF